MSDINLGGDAAVVGGVHSDSHDINTTTNNTTYSTTNNTVNNNNKTIYEAQRTDTEISQNNEQLFLQEVQLRFADGILDHKELAELSGLALQYHISDERAQIIIAKVRASSKALLGGQGNEYLTQHLLQEIFDAVQTNAVDVLLRKKHAFEETAKHSTNSDVQYFYNLMLASLSPEVSVMNFINSRTDDYWQIFWAYIAYVKLGNTDNAIALMPRLGGFGCPQGDISLLMAIENISDYRNNRQEYYKKQAERYLNQAVNDGMSEQLSPLWYAGKSIMEGVDKVEDWYRFYFEHTLKELRHQEKKDSLKSSNLQEKPIPPMPKFNAQNVKLNQMQGWNPLQAAQQMGLGQIPQMPSSNIMYQTTSVPPPMPQNQMLKTDHKSESMQLAAETRQARNDIDTPDPLESHYGIILTDINRLSHKYGCDNQKVHNVLDAFIRQSDNQEMFWTLLDIAEFNCSDSWISINEVINDHISQNNLQAGPDLHLFIVGGNDVIPIPQVQDPYENSCSEMIPTDMCYCFADTYLVDMLNGAGLALDISCARNNVSRLPLEDDDQMRTTIDEDLVAYFNISGLYAGGIPVGNVVMSSNSEWIPASATMSEHLPLLYSTKDPELIKNGMYISPKLLTSDYDAMNVFSTSLKRADMLMFNLHGADSPDMPGFYSYDEAFNPTLLQVSNARVFNTVACYGARYTGYSREQSMLLKAIYGGGVLLYTGSLIPVPMYYDVEMNEARELLMNPGTGSEVFMRLYPLYQFKGMTAGKALLKAKCDYFNMCRHVENDGFSFSTALMFGLYGNPMLHVRKCSHVIEAALQNDAMPPAPVKSMTKPLAKTMKQRLFQKDSTGSLLGQIRGYVDNNLAAIRNIVEKHLYEQLGLPPRQLESIDQFSRPTDEGEFDLGYLFNYFDPEALFDAQTTAEIDSNGKIKRIYTNK